MKKSKMKKIIIFDTTLRDGEQSPGASLNPKEKLEIARQLARLKVDIIEAGFPVVSEGDFEAVKKIAGSVKGAAICGLARAIRKDIDRAYEALKSSQRPRIHVFLATSPIHMKYKLKKAEDEILKLSFEAVKYARGKVPDIEFSPEDASRTEPAFLFKVVERAINAGATTINIPDTVGYATPEEFAALIRAIKKNVPNVEKAVLSVHCHNDLGMATANSLAAVIGGARQIECTINGIGERAGSASLEEIVMAIKTRKDFYRYATCVRSRELYKTSRLVSHLTGIMVQPNKAIIGQNAFSHEAGIHQDGILKKRATYEIMRPEDVGFGQTRLVLGKHSGRHAFNERLKRLSYSLSKDELTKAFARFKELADKKKEVYDDDLRVIVEDEIIRIPITWELEYMHSISGSKTIPTATIILKKGTKLFEDAGCGDGPVDACYKAIDRITGLKGRLLDYSLRAVTRGKDALGEVAVKVVFKKETISGRGASTDVIEASAKAYLDAVNKFIYRKV